MLITSITFSSTGVLSRFVVQVDLKTTTYLPFRRHSSYGVVYRCFYQDVPQALLVRILPVLQEDPVSIVSSIIQRF